MRDTLRALGLVLLMGCSSGGSQSADNGGGQDGVSKDAPSAGISISGKLIAGVQTQVSSALVQRVLPMSEPPDSKSSALVAGDPLVGYQLYCVTFATPPTAASGTADATGQVTLDLDAVDVAFGCFVLDAEGKAVATLLFRNGVQQGQTITLTGDTDLGSITVDLDNHVAQSDVTSTGTLTGSDDLPCPLGTWVVTVPREDCPPTAKVRFWFVKDANGKYLASFTIGLVMSPYTHKCDDHSEMDMAVTESDGALTFSFLNDPTCSKVYRTVTAKPNADCTTIALESSYGPCESCSEGQCGCGTGSLDCPQSFSATRE
jgi:hypothetical protein